MGALIELAVIAALVGGVVFGLHKAWDGFKAGIAAPFVQAQIAQDTPILTKAKADATAADQRATEADGRATQAQADTAECKTQADKQSADVLGWKSKAAANRAAADKARNDRAADSRQAADLVATYQRIAQAAPAKDQTCEANLAATDKLLRERAAARAKGPTK